MLITLGGDWELGDPPTKLVDDPSHIVSGYGRFTMMECQRISPLRALDPCVDQGGATPLCGCSNED